MGQRGSSKRTNKGEASSTARRAAGREVAGPKGEPPMGVVVKPVSRGQPSRVGRGFSVQELRQVGLDVSRARRLKLKVDPRRKSVHEKNVKILKKWLG